MGIGSDKAETQVDASARLFQLSDMGNWISQSKFGVVYGRERFQQRHPYRSWGDVEAAASCPLYLKTCTCVELTNVFDKHRWRISQLSHDLGLIAQRRDIP